MWKTVLKSVNFDYTILSIFACVSTVNIIGYHLKWFADLGNLSITYLFPIQIVISMLLYRALLVSKSSKWQFFGFLLAIITCMLVLQSGRSAILVVQITQALVVILFLFGMIHLLRKAFPEIYE